MMKSYTWRFPHVYGGKLAHLGAAVTTAVVARSRRARNKLVEIASAMM
jgi:hypothetical protein